MIKFVQRRLVNARYRGYKIRGHSPNLWVRAKRDLDDPRMGGADRLALERALLEQVRVVDARVTWWPAEELHRWKGRPVGSLIDARDADNLARAMRRVLEESTTILFTGRLNPQESRLLSRRRRSFCVCELILNSGGDYELRTWHETRMFQLITGTKCAFKSATLAIATGACVFTGLMLFGATAVQSFGPALLSVLAVLGHSQREVTEHTLGDGHFDDH